MDQEPLTPVQELRLQIAEYQGRKAGEAVSKAIGSLLVGLIFSGALVWSFSLTWPQGLVLAWMYCLLRDSILRLKE